MVKIIGDTTSGLPESFAQSHDIPIIPQIINIGDESYLGGVEIAPGDAGYLSVMHAAAEDQAQVLVDYFHDELGLTSIDVLAVPPAVVTHGGPGAPAVGFFTE